MTLPETGASTMCAPRPDTRPASSRVSSGLAVDMSMYTFRGARPARIPSGPSVTALTAAVFVTIVKTISLRSATSRGVSPQPMPASSNHPAFSFVRFQPLTV